MILREIARGGMGVVYEAVQESLGRHVALKVLPHWISDPNLLERFRREARSAAILHHTNIVPVFGVGEHEGVHYYAMQYIHGQSLDTVLREVKRLRGAAHASANPELPRDKALAASVALELLSGRFAPPARHAGADTVSEAAARAPSAGDDSSSRSAGSAQSSASSTWSIPSHSGFRYYRSVARIGLQVADALAYAHDQKLLHRDIKPSNLLLDLKGTVWVTDFGLAKAEGSDALTHTGDVVGTLRYLAPERFRGYADARSDVYSLGLTLYEMLTLEPAFATDQRPRLIDKILHEEAPAPRRLDPLIPRDLETIALKAMAKEPSDRYQTAGELAEDLRRYLSDRSILARRASALEQSMRWCKRNRWLTVTIATLAASLLTVAVLAVLYGDRQRQFALENRKAATKISTLAENLATSLVESNRLLAERNFDRGQAAFENDEIGTGLLWMIESWRSAQAAGDPALQHAARANLSAWLPYHPRLTAVLSHHRPVEDAAFSPDGKLVVTGADDGTARLWNAATGRPVGLILRHPREVTSVAFNPDGMTVLTGCLDGNSRLWRTATGEPAGPLLHSEGQGPVSAAFSPDGTRIVTGREGWAQVWDSATGRPLAGPYRKFGTPLAFSPDGKSILTPGDLAYLWDAATGQPAGVPLKNPGSSRSIAMSPDGTTVLTGRKDGTTQLWDAPTGEPLTPSLAAHSDRVRDVAFSPDGEMFLTASTDKTARLWDAVTGQPIGRPLFHHGPVVAVAFSPDGKSFLTTSSDYTVRLWRLEIYQPLKFVIEQQSSCTAARLSPDGRTILTGDFGGAARLWDRRDGRPLSPPLPHSARINNHAAAFSPDGTTVLTGSQDRMARQWSVPYGRAIGPPLEHQGDVWSVAFSPDGKTLLTVDETAIRFWDSATHSPKGTPVRQPAMATGAAFSPTGTTFAAAYDNGTVQLRDVATGSTQGEAFPHPGSVEALAFSPDGKSILTGCEDGMARLWDVASGNLLLPPIVTGRWVWSVAFRADGKLLATGNSTSARLWDTATGQPVGPMLPHSGNVVDVGFSPDGDALVTASLGDGASLFDVPSEVPENLGLVASWVELLTGLKLDALHGSIHVLDNAAWLASRDRLDQQGGPPLMPEYAPSATAVQQTRLSITLAKIRFRELQTRQLLASSLLEEGRPFEAIAALRQARSIADRLRLKYPDNRNYVHMLAAIDNNLAWLLATAREPKVHDPSQAVQLARTAVGFVPGNALYWNTLGTACYRAGDWSGAIEALTRSNECNAKMTLAFNGYFLAMAHQRRGNSNAAQLWFDIAGRWHRRRFPNNPELRQFRTEAAEVLGLEPRAARWNDRTPGDAAMARLIQNADPAATWAREWLNAPEAHPTPPLEPSSSQEAPNARNAAGWP